MPLPRVRLRASALSAWVLLTTSGMPGSANAGTPNPTLPAANAPTLPAESDSLDTATPSRFPVIGAPPGWALGAEAYGGIAAQWTGGQDRAHAFAGGVVRLRFHYVQGGGFVELSDSGESTALREAVQEHYRAAGGFVGAFFPYSRWVDLEATVGLGSKTYSNPSAVYGAGGLHETLPSLTLRAGVSDRTTERALGARIGAALAFGIDLGARDVVFRRTFLLPDGTVGETTGTTAIGGVSVGLVLALGLELGGGAPSPR